MIRQKGMTPVGDAHIRFGPPQPVMQQVTRDLMPDLLLPLL